MPNAIIIHGCSSSPEESKEYSESKHWMPWVEKELIARGISTTVPSMPESWVPDYERWKAEFEKQNINEQTTLIGHSCGCAFLVRWLGDSKRKIDKLILVAPWNKKGPSFFFDGPEVVDGLLSSDHGSLEGPAGADVKTDVLARRILRDCGKLGSITTAATPKTYQKIRPINDLNLAVAPNFQGPYRDVRINEESPEQKQYPDDRSGNVGPDHPSSLSPKF